MSLEIEEQSSMDQPVEMNHESQKKMKTYTREFLISLSELDVCKKLPSAFDQSILSEFEDSSQDRQRISGNLSANSFRRNEYGSSPPTRGDSNSYSRGVHGRWESRSSTRSDKDSDSQSDWDPSESGRRYGNQSRRSWQVPEHDGLLGSGSFPRPSGYAAGVSAPKLRANDQYQLSKTNEPYHPPRPYKAAPHSRRETNDSFNDETFGSSEDTSEDRAEEERKRRVSFELMRKEQQKAFQEKQKLNPEKRKDGFDISTLMEDSKDEKILLNKSNESGDSVILKNSNNDSEKSSLPPQTPASRPLVPPGFTSTNMERNLGPKSVIHPHTVEVVNPELGNSLAHAKGNHVLNGTSDNQVEKQSSEQKGLTDHQLGSTNMSINNMSEKNLNALSSKTTDMDGQLYKNSYHSEAVEASESEVIDLNAEKVTGNKIVGESNQNHSTSILDKFFGTAITGGGPSSFIEHHDSKVDETLIPPATQSSKFARWFLEEEKKPVDDLSSRRNDLLSLIVGGEKGGLLVSDVKNTDHVLPNIPFQSSEPADGHTTPNVTSAVVENSELYKNKPQAVPVVMTCEDLEQSMLSEISENVATSHPPIQVVSIPDKKIEPPKATIDDSASQHLLSLLQKGTSLKDIEPSQNLEIQSSEKLHNNEGASLASFDSAVHDSKELNTENASNSGQTLTLETLFGTAFMKELQSVGAPVSVQRGSVGNARVDNLEPHEFPFPGMDDGHMPTNEIGSNTISYESSVLTSKQRVQTKPVMIEERWFDDPQTELDSSQLRTGLKSKLGGFDGPVDLRLPEEDSLIMVNDPLSLQKYATAGNIAKTEVSPSPNTQVGIAEKLAFNSIFKDERSFMGGQEGQPFLRGPYDPREPDIPYQGLSVQPSSPRLHPPHSNHLGPLFHQLDSHPSNINAQMKFMAPEGIIHHDPPPNRQFPANMLRPPFHHPSTGLSGLDPPSHHPMLQQMHMSGNFPPPHLLQGFPRSSPMPAPPNRGAPLPPHVNNQMNNFMPEMNPLQGFPFSHRQPNFAGLGMPPPAPDAGGGSNHPEAIQRLIEMGLRSNSKQIQPFATGGPGQGMYGNELDMGFGYR